MPIVELDARSVGKLPVVPGKRVEYFDATVRGFAVRVTPAGARSYVVTYWKDGVNRRVTIGSVDKVKLADARDEAKKLLASAELGSDPALEKREAREERRRESEAAKFSDICDRFVKDQSPEWRPATRKGWGRYLDNEIKPALGEKRPEAISPDDVRDFIDGIKYGVQGGTDEKGVPKWKRKPAPVSARRCFEVLRRLCAWAVWKRYLTVSPCNAAQPFERRRTGKRKGASAKPFTDDQLRSVFSAVKGTELVHLAELVARTGVRSHEARAARWQDIDDKAKLWRVPPDMHKTGDSTGRPHLVPLSKGALRVVRAIQEQNLATGHRNSPWLFPAPTDSCDVCGMGGHADKPNKATATVKEAAGITDRGLLHRFRDTIKTRMSEHGIVDRVSEHVLGHVVPGIAGTYDHAEMLPQRREALEWWDTALDRILKAKKGRAKTVTIASAATFARTGSRSRA